MQENVPFMVDFRTLPGVKKHQRLVDEIHKCAIVANISVICCHSLQNSVYINML